MNNKTLKRILPTMLITTLLLTGCNKTKEACNVKDPHLHLYQKEISSSQVLSSYFNSEEEDYQGFTKTDDIKLMDEYDQAFYAAIGDTPLFEGIYHWNYLYNLMCKHQDYIRFENISYENVEIEVYDTEGNRGTKHVLIPTKSYKEKHYASGNTGVVRIYHHLFYGYKVEERDGKLQLIKSPLVDDIREVLEEYPYFTENCFEIVTKDIEFTPSTLGFLSADSFTCFNHPDLENKSMSLDKTLKKAH